MLKYRIIFYYKVKYVVHVLLLFVYLTGLPHGQEIRKSQEKRGFLKKCQEKSVNLTKFKKKSDFVSLNLQFFFQSIQMVKN